MHQPAEYDVGSISSFIYLRDGQFQIEVLTFHDTRAFPREHRHPDVDGVELLYYGHIPFTIDGRRVPIYPEPGSMIFDKFPATVVLCGQWHGSEPGIMPGSIFVSLQRWNNGVPPSSVLLNWEGVPISKKHWRLLHEHPEARWTRTVHKSSSLIP